MASARWIHRLALLAVCAAGTVVYLNSFAGVFLYDDISQIVDNPRVHTLWPPMWLQETTRPLLDLTLAANYAISELNAWSYHAANLLIHLFCGVLLYGILHRTLLLQKRSSILPFVCALLWIVHPVNTQSVTYIIQRTESLMGLFLLTTLYCMIRGHGSAKASGWYAASIISCVCAVLTKEVAVVAPVVCLLYDRQFLTGTFSGALRQRWQLYAGLTASWCLIALCFAFNWSGSDHPSAGFGLQAISSQAYLRTQPDVILHYILLCVWPVSLCFDYGWPTQESWQAAMPTGAIVLGLFIAAAWAYDRRQALGFVGLCFFVILAPTSSILPIGVAAAEHRLYLPLAAVIVVVVVVAQRVLSWPLNRYRNHVLVVLCVTFATWLGSRTADRNGDYASAVGMWQDVVSKRPQNRTAYNNLGRALFVSGDEAGALASFKQAVSVDRRYVEGWFNLGNVYAARGDDEQAIVHYSRALRLNDRYAPLHSRIGHVLLRTRQFQKATEHYHRAVELGANDVELLTNFGIALVHVQQAEEALSYLKAVDQQGTLNASGIYYLGLALGQTGQASEAFDSFRRVLKINPGHPEAHNSIGKILLQLGDVRLAITHFEQALANRSSFTDARHNLISARAQLASGVSE